MHNRFSGVRRSFEMSRCLAHRRAFAVHGVDDAWFAVGGNDGDAVHGDVVNDQTSYLMRIERFLGFRSNFSDELAEWGHRFDSAAGLGACPARHHRQRRAATNFESSHDPAAAPCPVR